MWPADPRSARVLLLIFVSRMEMLNTTDCQGQPGLEAGRVEVWFGLRSVEPLSRDSGASRPPHPPISPQSSPGASSLSEIWISINENLTTSSSKENFIFRNEKSVLIRILYSVKSINSGKNIEIPQPNLATIKHGH